jgi:RNA polymerase sigma-70 factor (ECF subfamily)
MSEEYKPPSDHEIFVSLQSELRRIARAMMRSERLDHTLQPTALVNEVFMRLSKTNVSPDVWADSARAIGLISHAMEHILIDHAKAHKAKKRGGAHRQRVPLDEQQAREFGDGELKFPVDSDLIVPPEQIEKVLAVRQALDLLCKTKPRQARVLQLQYFGGLELEEISAVLGVSLETVKLDARKAKFFLKPYLPNR